jgi:hypothetical protein
MSKLSENALTGISWTELPPHLDHCTAEIMRPGFAGKSCLSFKAFPQFQTPSTGVPDILPEKHYKQILITLDAAHGGERHILLLGQPIFQLLSPTLPPPSLSKKYTGGCASHQLGLSPFNALPGGAPLALSGHPARPAGYRMPQTPLSPQKLILQLLPLAQAACDYLKPQPFIYEK